MGGSLLSQGTATRPVTFTSSHAYTTFESDQPWGQIELDGGEADFDYTVITRAGNENVDEFHKQ